LVDYTVAGIDEGNHGGNSQHGLGVEHSTVGYSQVMGQASAVPGLNTVAYSAMNYTQGAVILPGTNNTNGYSFVDITPQTHAAGGSANFNTTSPPSSGSLGTTVTDGGVTWQNVGYALNGYTFGSVAACEGSGCTPTQPASTVVFTFPSQGSTAANVALKNVTTRYQISVSGRSPVSAYNSGNPGGWYVTSVPTPYAGGSTQVQIAVANFPTGSLGSATGCSVAFYPVGIRVYLANNSYVHNFDNITISGAYASATSTFTNFPLCGFDISGGVGLSLHGDHVEGFQYGACIGLYAATSGVTIDNLQPDSFLANGVLISNQQGAKAVTNLAIRNMSCRGAGGANPTNCIVDQQNGNTITFANNPDVEEYKLDGNGFAHALLKVCGEMTRGWCDDGMTNSLYSSGNKIFSINDSTGVISGSGSTATAKLTSDTMLTCGPHFCSTQVVTITGLWANTTYGFRCSGDWQTNSTFMVLAAGGCVDTGGSQCLNQGATSASYAEHVRIYYGGTSSAYGYLAGASGTNFNYFIGTAASAANTPFEFYIDGEFTTDSSSGQEFALVVSPESNSTIVVLHSTACTLFQ
jgi:hypothetical protein